MDYIFELCVSYCRTTCALYIDDDGASLPTRAHTRTHAHTPWYRKTLRICSGSTLNRPGAGRAPVEPPLSSSVCSQNKPRGVSGSPPRAIKPALARAAHADERNKPETGATFPTTNASATPVIRLSRANSPPSPRARTATRSATAPSVLVLVNGTNCSAALIRYFRGNFKKWIWMNI